MSIFFRVDFNFTSFYVVKVDDFFLHYLQKVNLFDVNLGRVVGPVGHYLLFSTVHACVKGLVGTCGISGAYRRPLTSLTVSVV